MKNIFISLDNGENMLIYTNTLSIYECSIWVEKATSAKIIDIYPIEDNEIQFYCIDGRVWADTPKIESKVREIINN